MFHQIILRWIGVIVIALGVTCSSTTAQDVHWRSTLREIREAHRRLREELLRSVHVEIQERSKDASGKSSVKPVLTVDCKDGMIRAKKGDHVGAVNPDYTFQVKLGDPPTVDFLDGGQRSERLSKEDTEDAILNKLLQSVRFLAPLYEVFTSRDFKLSSVQQTNGQIVVKGEYATSDGWMYKDLTIVLDPSNAYQLVSTEYVITRKNVTPGPGRITGKYTYYTEPFADTDYFLLKTYESTTRVIDDPDWWETHTADFSNWKRTDITDAKFYLSAYGLPEPAKSAFDDRPNWLRVAAGIILAIIAGVLVITAIKRRNK